MNKELNNILKVFRKNSRPPKKRTTTTRIFTPMSVAHVDDEDDLKKEESSSASDERFFHHHHHLHHVDKVLSNGDFYTGQFHEGFPHGNGKYLWKDGCMYVGEWQKGSTMGKGRFSWPSGATYEGDFNGGYMDGKGTYIGSCGDTYKGCWVMDLRHGNGNQSYLNGDFYEGEWRKGLQSGHGMYQWKNGNRYIGQWRHGVFHGNGTLMWSNGNRYEGCWEEGLPKGKGNFYVEVWSNDHPKIEEQKSGIHRLSNGSSFQGHHLEDVDPHEKVIEELKRGGFEVCSCEKILIFPSQKTSDMPRIDEDEQQPTIFKKGSGGVSRERPSRVSNFSSCEDGFSYRMMGSPLVDSSIPRGVPNLRLKTVKRPGVTIAKGHKNYDLMLNLQLGIRHAVGRPAPATSLDLKSSAFDPKEKVWTKFPPEGSKHTPPHPSVEFRWKDYCPVVFRALRKLFKVDPADYMISLCGNEALRELSSPGKSGSFFYLTADDRYMIKTMKKAEVKVFLRMLPGYYQHVRTFENTLVTKFYGLHCVRLTGTSQKKVRFVIMGNLFCSQYTIHRRFDLKGSTFGRSTSKSEAEIDPTTTFKDLDLNYIFRLRKAWYQELCRQVDRDCDFLEQERIMDYSLLVGLHFRGISCNDAVTSSDHSSGSNTSDDGAPRLSGVDVDPLVVDPSRWTQLGVRMHARAELTRRKSVCDAPQLIGEPTGELYEIIIFFGIIDILQDYDISKKLEHAYKSFHYDPTSISAVDPRLYSRRFRDFIFRVFVEDTI